MKFELKVVGGSIKFRRVSDNKSLKKKLPGQVGVRLKCWFQGLRQSPRVEELDRGLEGKGLDPDHLADGGHRPETSGVVPFKAQAHHAACL